MGILGNIFGSVQVDGNIIKGSLEGAGRLAKDIRSAVTGRADPALLAEIESKIVDMEGSLNMAQIEVNKIEAGSPSFFVAGWRPSIGWICSIGLGFHFVVSPLLVWVSELFMHVSVTPPSMDSSALMSLVLALLGMGGFRSYERMKGKERN